MSRTPRCLAALLLGLGALRVADARNVALLVGVGRLEDPYLQSYQLRGPAADLDSMQQALATGWGFAPADIRTLRDREATHDRILAEIDALEERSTPGDTVLIYFSGHGTSANASDNGFDLPYATGAWIPYDIDLRTAHASQATLIIGRRDLVPRLRRLDRGGRMVLVVSDSCFSGQVVRTTSQTSTRSRYLPNLTRDLGESRAPGAGPEPARHEPSRPSARPPPPPYPYEHVILMSGASDSEEAADIPTRQALEASPTIDGKFHGAFTDAFLRLLAGRLLVGAFSYSEARDALGAFLEHQHFAQHPQLLPALAEDPQDVGSAPFLGMAARAMPTSTRSRRARSLRVRLESVAPGLRAAVGRISGVTLVDREGDLILRERAGQAHLMGPAGDPVITAGSDDPRILRRIAAQVWLDRVLPSSSRELGLRAETDPGSRGNTYLQCESFVFEVRVQKPAHLVVLDLDPSGGLTLLYPARPVERHPVPAGSVEVIPGGAPADRIHVIPPFGIDRVAVLAFEQPPAFVDELIGADRFQFDGVQADVLARGLAGVKGAVDLQLLDVRTYPASGGACRP